jgi:very-short-patch-repair endonuclease
MEIGRRTWFSEGWSAMLKQVSLHTELRAAKNKFPYFPLSPEVSPGFQAAFDGLNEKRLCGPTGLWGALTGWRDMNAEGRVDILQTNLIERRTVMHILLFILAFIAFSVYSSKKNKPLKEEPIPPPRLADWQVATPKTVNWQDLFIDRCESPAETAFLNAIIPAYQLVPEKGTLKGGGLELQLQIPIGHYRVDFLVNKNLVVEIDGAAYHSSPEAIERDRSRDEFLVKSGYVVLRIPAKIVFYSPSEAVQRVRCAISNLAHERSIRAQEAARSATVPKPDPPRTFFGGLGQALAHASEFMEGALVSQKAKEAFDQASFPQVYSIKKALELAEQTMKVETWRRSSPRANQLYLESLRQLREVTGPSSFSPVPIGPFRVPDIDPDPKYNASIKGMYSVLLRERSQYLNDVRMRLENDGELAKLFKEALGQLVENSDDLWHLIYAANPSYTVNRVGNVPDTVVGVL